MPTFVWGSGCRRFESCNTDVEWLDRTTVCMANLVIFTGVRFALGWHGGGARRQVGALQCLTNRGSRLHVACSGSVASTREAENKQQHRTVRGGIVIKNDDGTKLNAEFSVEREGQTWLLRLSARGGIVGSPSEINPDYIPALVVLLPKLDVAGSSPVARSEISKATATTYVAVAFFFVSVGISRVTVR